MMIPGLTAEETERVHELRRLVAPWMVVDEEDLRRFVADVLEGFAFPDEPCCPDHCSPFDFLYALVFAKNRRTGAPERTLLGVGSRGGYKTLGFAVSEAIGIAAGEQIAHIGAIQAQAHRCYSYVRKMARHEPFSQVVAGKTTQRGTATTTGGSLEVLWATRNQLNSPHVPTVRFDEIELADPEIAAEALGILSDAPGLEPSLAEISSLKFAAGVVAKKIASAAEQDRTVYTWCYKEVSEPCPDERSGTTRAYAYVDRDALDALTEDELVRLPATEREMYEAVEVFDGCLTCPLLPSCRGDLKRASGTQSIDGTILKYRPASRAFWIMQMESRLTTVEGAVFSSFRPGGSLRTHVRALADLGGFSLERGPVWLSLDPGRHHPAVGLWQEVVRPTKKIARWIYSGALVCYDEIHDYNADMDLKLPELAELMEQLLERYGLAKADVVVACDPAGNQEDDLGESTVEWLTANGWLVETPQSLIADRVESIEARLKFINGKTGMVFVAERTTAHVSSFKNYRYARDKRTGLILDKPFKDGINDHCSDATGYLVSAVEVEGPGDPAAGGEREELED